MKVLRIGLILFVSLLSLLVLALMLLFLAPALPTWLAQKAVSGVPGSQVRIEKIDLDWNGLVAREVHVLMEEGVSVSVRDVNLSVVFLPLLKKEVRVDQLVVSGVVLDLTRMEPSAGEDEEDKEPFRGILTPIREMGLKLFVDGVDVSGKFFLPEDRGGDFNISGGGLAPGVTGVLISKATIHMPPEAAGGIARVITSQRISITQDEKGISQVAAESQSIASGPAVTGEARLFATLQAGVSEEGEAYELAVRAPEGERIAAVEAVYTPQQDQFNFSFRTNVGEATVAALGFEGLLPQFTVRGAGEGTFVLDELKGSATGEFSGSVLPVDAESGQQLPRIDFELQYDLAGDPDVLALRKVKLEGAVGGEQAVRLVLSPDLVINLADPVGALPTTSLAEVFLDVPLHVLASDQVKEGRLQGQFDIRKIHQTVSLQSAQPMRLTDLLLIGETMPTEPLFLQFTPSASFDGMKVDFAVGGIVGKLGDQSLVDGAVQGSLALDQAKAQLAEATIRGNLRADLDALYPLVSPEVAEAAQQGRMNVRFSASMPQGAHLLSGQFNSMLSDVRPPEAEELMSLRINGSFEADLEKQTFYLNAPITLVGPAGQTELTAELQVSAADHLVRLGAALSGPDVYADDFIALSTAYTAPATDEAAGTPEPASPTPETPDTPDSQALWSDFVGEASSTIGRIVIGANEITDFNARVSITPDKIELSHFQAALAGEPITAAFSLAFSGSAESPYVLQAQFSITEFDLGAADQALRKEQPPLVEGLFTANGRFQGSGPDLATAAEWIEGSVAVEAKKATYYPLGNFQAPVVSGLVGAASQILPGLLKDKGQQNFAIASQQIFSLLQGVETEHLVVDLDVKEGLHININNFELLSSQLSFAGSGSLDVELSQSPTQWPFSLNLKMGAKGNAAHLFNDIGALNPQQDEWGYYTTKIDFPMGGRIGMPTSGLGQSLLNMTQSFANPQRVELPEPDINEAPRQESPPPESEEGESEQQQEPDPLNLLFDLLNRQSRKPQENPSQ